MAWGRTKTEHAGPKRGKGYWGKKAVAKQASKRTRRREDHMVAHATEYEDAPSRSQRSAHRRSTDAHYSSNAQR